MNPVKLEVSMERFDTLFDEAINALLAIDGKDRHRQTCLVYKLVENGGNKSRAAMDAGYGNSRKKQNKPDEATLLAAAAEGQRILKKPTVDAAYNALLKLKVYTSTISSTLDKDGIVAALYFVARNNIIKAPQAAVRALDVIANLKQYYETPKEINDVLEAIKLIVPTMPDINDIERKKLEKQGLLQAEDEK